MSYQRTKEKVTLSPPPRLVPPNTIDKLHTGVYKPVPFEPVRVGASDHIRYKSKGNLC